MMSWTNYHSHTHFCDGKNAPEDYILEAIRLGVASYGFSSHAPLAKPMPWSMESQNAADYFAEIARLKQRYKGQIEIYSSLEMDFIPGNSSAERTSPHSHSLDYRLGAVHFVEQFRDGSYWEIDGSPEHFAEGIKKIFKGSPQRAISRYYELIRWMVMLDSPDIVAHFDKIKLNNPKNLWFRESDEWYRKEVEKTLRVIANMGSIIEVNTRGLYQGKTLDLYPATWIIERMRAHRIPVTISSDAHTPQEITAGFEVAARILKNAGYTHVFVLHKGKWMEAPFNEMGIQWPEREPFSGKILAS